MKDIKKELFKVKGGDFPKWYDSLTKYEKIQYKKIMEELGKNVKSNKQPPIVYILYIFITNTHTL